VSTFSDSEIPFFGLEISLIALLLALFVIATMAILVFCATHSKGGLSVTKPAEKNVTNRSSASAILCANETGASLNAHSPVCVPNILRGNVNEEK